MAYTKNANAKKQSKKESTEIKQTWNEITGVMRIYGNTFESGKGKDKKSFTKWSVAIANKTDDGYQNFYMPIRFGGKNSHEPETDGLQTININHAFLSVDCYTNKNGDEVKSPVIVVLDNDVMGEDEEIPF